MYESGRITAPEPIWGNYDALLTILHSMYS